MQEGKCSKYIGIICVSLGSIEKGPESIDFNQAKTSQHGIKSNGQVEKVQWQKTQTIDVK